jgi:hypothetical protein
MIDLLPLSSRIYRRLIVLYPEDLRRDYGADMAFVFAEDLEAARREAGMRGVVRVWRCALCEFVRLALPDHASSPAVSVPAVWFALSSIIMSAEVAMALRHSPHTPRPSHALCAALLLPSLTAPLMSLAIMWGCRGSAIISLGLSDPPEEKGQPCSKSAI